MEENNYRSVKQPGNSTQSDEEDFDSRRDRYYDWEERRGMARDTWDAMTDGMYEGYDCDYDFLGF